MNHDQRACAQHTDNCPYAAPSERAAADRLLSPKRSKLKPKSKRPAKVAKADKRTERTDRMTWIREEVFRRAGGRCEVWHPNGLDSEAEGSSGFYRCENGPMILDHWRGGVGRRRQEESAQTCWAICTACDRQRTANRPSAEYWNVAHQAHCAHHGFAFKPHITRELRTTIARSA